MCNKQIQVGPEYSPVPLAKGKGRLRKFKC